MCFEHNVSLSNLFYVLSILQIFTITVGTHSSSKTSTYWKHFTITLFLGTSHLINSDSISHVRRKGISKFCEVMSLYTNSYIIIMGHLFWMSPTHKYVPYSRSNEQKKTNRSLPMQDSIKMPYFPNSLRITNNIFQTTSIKRIFNLQIYHHTAVQSENNYFVSFFISCHDYKENKSAWQWWKLPK